MTRQILYLKALEKKALKTLGPQEKKNLEVDLLTNPLQGSIIQGAGGARKIRFPIKKRGMGKSGGLRVIHYFWNGEDKIFILDVYTKNEKADIDEEEKKDIKEFINFLKKGGE